MSLRLRSLYTLRVVGSAPSLKPCRSQNTVGGEGGWGGCMCVCVEARIRRGERTARVCECARVCMRVRVRVRARHARSRRGGTSQRRACVRAWVGACARGRLKADPLRSSPHTPTHGSSSCRPLHKAIHPPPHTLTFRVLEPRGRLDGPLRALGHRVCVRVRAYVREPAFLPACLPAWV